MPRTSYAAKQTALQKAIEKLEKQKAALQASRRKPAIAEIIKSMHEYGITPEEIAAAYSSDKKTRVAKKATVVAARKPVAAKYRNAETGDTWSGRGKPPRWLSEAEAAGKTRESFLIA